MQTFRNEAGLLVGSYAVPRQVESASTFRKGGRGVVLGLVGGVTIEPNRLLQQFETQADPALRLNGVKAEALTGPAPEAHVWWWD
jgi:hypothetical protein